jgi:hypothetical protein
MLLALRQLYKSLWLALRAALHRRGGGADAAADPSVAGSPTQERRQRRQTGTGFGRVVREPAERHLFHGRLSARTHTRTHAQDDCVDSLFMVAGDRWDLGRWRRGPPARCQPADDTAVRRHQPWSGARGPCAGGESPCWHGCNAGHLTRCAVRLAWSLSDVHRLERGGGGYLGIAAQAPDCSRFVRVLACVQVSGTRRRLSVLSEGGWAAGSGAGCARARKCNARQQCRAARCA